jgi:hypothetical protein
MMSTTASSDSGASTTLPDGDTGLVERRPGLGDDSEDDDGLDIHRHGGNMWFYDDFPCMGPAYNEVSDQDKEMVPRTTQVGGREGHHVLHLLQEHGLVVADGVADGFAGALRRGRDQRTRQLRGRT